jgi:restriction system protein
MPESRYSRLTPFSDADLDEFYVRREQMYSLEAAAASGRSPIFVVGHRGVGKTSLVQVFAHKLPAIRPISWVAATADWRQQDLSRKITDAARESGSLLVIDDADHLSRSSIVKLSKTMGDRRSIQVILVGTEKFGRTLAPLFPDATTIALGDLSHAEFDELISRRIPGNQTQAQSVLREFFSRSHGNPATVAAALEALRSGVIPSSEGLLEAVSDFSAAGFLGPNGRPLTRDTQSERRIILDVSAANAEILTLLGEQPELLWQVPSRKFEKLVAEILEKQGYDVDLTPASGDGGFDMYAARKDGLGKFLYLVECKRYTPPNKVGVEIVRAPQRGCTGETGNRWRDCDDLIFHRRCRKVPARAATPHESP